MTNEEIDCLERLEARLGENMLAVANYAILLDELKGHKAKLREALSACLLMSPLDPVARGEMIRRVLKETA